MTNTSHLERLVIQVWAFVVLCLLGSAFLRAESLAAIELIQAPPAELLAQLEASRGHYDGTQPLELLNLLALLEERTPGPESPAIEQAILDLLGEWPEALAPVLKTMETGDESLLRQIAARVRRTLSPPADRPRPASFDTAFVGRNPLSEYGGIERVEPDAAAILMIEASSRQPDPFTPALLAAMSRIIAEGGILVLIAPGARPWPAALKNWAHAHDVALPDGNRPLVGPGRPARDQDYLSLADVPWSPDEQPGTATAAAWEQWSGKAPVRTSDYQGALVVVDHHRDATLIYSCVDLHEAPMYRDNLLYWIYGSRLPEAQQAHPGEWELALTGSTPHTPWLKPIAGEPVNVLYLTDNLFKRGMLELHQRLSVASRYVPYAAAPAMTGSQLPNPPARMSLRSILAFQEALPWAETVLCDTGRVNLLRSLVYDIMGTVSIDLLPRRVRRQLYAAVHERGMGLVVAGDESVAAALPDVMARLTAAKEIAVSMPFMPDRLVRSVTRGKGRIVWFSRHLDHSYLEYGNLSVSDLGAAWQVPGLERPRQVVRADEFAYAALAKAVRYSAGHEPLIAGIERRNAAIVVSLNQRAGVSAQWTLRDAYGEIVATETSAGEGSEIAWDLPVALMRPMIVECRLLTWGGIVVDAAAIALLPELPPAITAIRTDRGWYKPGEVIQVTVERLAAPAGSTTITARDTWGRMVFQGDGETAAIPVLQPLSRLWDIEVVVRDEAGGIVDRSRLPVGIVLPSRELDYDVTGVLLKPAILLPMIRDRMGISVTYGDAETAFRGNLELSAGIWSDPVGIAPTLGARTAATERQPCLSAPAFRLQAVRDMRETAPRWARLGVTDYMIADECQLGGRCLSEHSMRRFRDWLQGEYADLAALNDEWGSAHASWASIQALTGATASRPGAIVDYDRFHLWEFAEYASYLQMLGDDTIPGFKTGHSGGIMDNQMMRLSNAVWYYGVDEVAVAGKRPGALIGSWFEPGYRFREDHEVEARRWAWWHLFRGTTRQQLWYPKTGLPAIHADLSRPFAAFSWMAEEMADLRRGMGKLILNSARDEGPAAVYYSLRSNLTKMALAELTGTKMPGYKGDAAFRNAVLANQVECRYINEFQIEDGHLASRGTRLLFLPRLISLSAAERARLTAFVEAGGTLVADRRPGERNQHGTLVEPTWSREMFGSEDRGRVVTPRGQGRCVLLNADVTPEDVALAAELMAMAGVTPRLQVFDAQGEPVPVDRGHFDDGAAAYHGFVLNGRGMVNPDQEIAVTARFSAPAHLYDCRAGSWLGETDSLAVKLQPGIAHLYAALPWRLNKLHVTLGAASARPGQVVALDLQCEAEGKIGRQVLWIRVAAPDGEWQPAYEKRLLSENGHAAWQLPLPLDAPVGSWRLLVRDAATGIAGEALLEVQP